MALKREPIDNVRPIIEHLLALYPTDYSVHFMAALFYRQVSIEKEDKSIEQTALKHLERAIFYNRGDEGHLWRVWEEYFPKYGPSVRVV